MRRSRLFQCAVLVMLAAATVALQSQTQASPEPAEPLRLYGRVMSGAEPVPGAQVEFVHPDHPEVVLARTDADATGRYETTIRQRGEIIGYAFEEKPVSYAMFATLTIAADAREQEFDLELPTASLCMQIVDAVSGRPIPRAEVDRWIRNADGMVHAGKTMADADGRYRLTRHRQGSATFLVKAPGYRVAETVSELREREHAEVRVALFPAAGTGGRVYGPDGAPVAGAVVMGGYPGDRTTGPILRARTDAEGEFRFPSDPEDGTSFYVIAPDHALAVTTLRASDDNVIRLEPIAEDGGVRLGCLPARRTLR